MNGQGEISQYTVLKNSNEYRFTGKKSHSVYNGGDTGLFYFIPLKSLLIIINLLDENKDNLRICNERAL